MHVVDPNNLCLSYDGYTIVICNHNHIGSYLMYTMFGLSILAICSRMLSPCYYHIKQLISDRIRSAELISLTRQRSAIYTIDHLV